MGKKIKPSAVVKDLGVWVDNAVTFVIDDSPVFNCPRVACIGYVIFSWLRRMNRIKHLDSKTLILIINDLISSRLFHCSNVCGNTSGKNICKLQLIQARAGLFGESRLTLT